jgi:acid phosphatase type 7
VRNGTCVAPGTAPTHLVIGMGGQSLEQFVTDPKHWSIFRAEDYGYGRVKASRKRFSFELVGDRSNEVHDRLVLEKKKWS